MAHCKEQAKGPVHAKQPIAPRSCDSAAAIIFDNVFKWKMTQRILIVNNILWRPKWLIEEMQGRAAPLLNEENAFVPTHICQQTPSVLNCLLKICTETNLINTVFSQMNQDSIFNLNCHHHPFNLHLKQFIYLA